MALQLANFASTTLAAPVAPTDTSISVSSGTGALFPALGGGDWFPVVCVAASGNPEIMRCTARSGDVLTVTRGQEGTAARSFNSGDRVDLRLTKAAIAAFTLLTQLAAVALSGAYGDLSGTPSLGSLAALNQVPDGSIGSTQLADGGVATVDIADAAVTLAKMAALAQATIIGRAAGAGNGAPVALTGDQVSAIAAAFVADNGTNPGKQGVVPASSVGDGAAPPKVLRADATWGRTPFESQLLQIRNEQAQGVSGGSTTGDGTWRQMAINTVKQNDVSGASLSSNQITLPAGTYMLDAHMLINTDIGSGSHYAQAKLYNVSDSADVMVGTQQSRDGGSSGFMFGAVCPVRGRFTLAAQKVVEFRYRTNTGNANGQGSPLGAGTEIYSDVMFWKVG